MNMLIAPTERQGIELLKAMKADRDDWRVVSYCGLTLAYRPDTLIVIRPHDGDTDSQVERATHLWFEEVVPQVISRARHVVQL